MDEAQMNDVYDPYDPSLWVMDDRNAMSPDELEAFSLPERAKEKLDALFYEIFGLNDKVSSAA